MKVFISWSGDRSRAVAEALNDWLQRVIQAIKPFYSPDIDKGAKWSNEIDEALEGTQFGIVCLTPDNLESIWIHYEAGALSKTKGASIWTFLHGVKPADIKPPLGKFQHTVANKEDILKLVQSINTKLPEPLRDSVLKEIYEDSWAKLEVRLKEAEKITGKSKPINLNDFSEPVRSSDSKLDEILELLRELGRSPDPFAYDLNSIPNLSHNYRNSRFKSMVFSILSDDGKFTPAKVENSLKVCVPNSEIQLRIMGKDVSASVLFEKPISFREGQEYMNKFEKKIGVSIRGFSLINLNGEPENVMTW